MQATDSTAIEANADEVDVADGNLLEASEAAAILRWSARTLARAADAGEIRAVRLRPGGHRRYPADEVERLRAASLLGPDDDDDDLQAAATGAATLGETA